MVMVKGDEKSRVYRDRMETLKSFQEANELPDKLTKAMVRTLYCTAWDRTVLYCTVLHCTVLYCTVLYCTVLYPMY